MQHTDFYKIYDQLREQEKLELAAAVKAHGGQYVFIDCDSDDASDRWDERDDRYDIPIIHGATKYIDGYEDYYVSRVEITEIGVSILGFRTEYESPVDEEYLQYIFPGEINSIIDFIPGTETVQDVSTNKYN